MSLDNKGVYKVEALLDLGQAGGDEDLSGEVFESLKRGLKSMVGAPPFKESVTVLTAKVTPWSTPKPPPTSTTEPRRRQPDDRVWEHCATSEPFVSADPTWLPRPPPGSVTSWELVQVLRDESRGSIRVFWKRLLP